MVEGAWWGGFVDEVGPGGEGWAVALDAFGYGLLVVVLGREVLHADVVAGESFGGLAVAWLLARHPELVRAGVVQSGSFWHRAGGRWGDEGPGDLLRLLQQGGADVTRPVVVQVGTEEDLLLPLNRAYRDALLQQGAQLGYREVRGGHDYAWWRAGLIEALGELERLQR